MTCFQHPPRRGSPASLQSPAHRRLQHQLQRGVFGVALLLLLSACQAQPATAPAANEEATLLARIKAGIGDASCSSDAQCRSLGVGERACGGPEQWWAWSVNSPQAAQLPAWAEKLSTLAKQRNATSGMVGNCRYQPDPGAVCQAQRCVLVVPALAR